MRRQTNAINYGRTLPLAQGVKFDVGDETTHLLSTPANENPPLREGAKKMQP